MPASSRGGLKGFQQVLQLYAHREADDPLQGDKWKHVGLDEPLYSQAFPGRRLAHAAPSLKSGSDVLRALALSPRKQGSGYKATHSGTRGGVQAGRGFTEAAGSNPVNTSCANKRPGIQGKPSPAIV